MARYGYLIVVYAAMAAAAPVHGHHAAGAVFMDEEIQIEGIVSEFNFVNPHVNIILSVINDDGAEISWQATAPAPVSLRRAGWSADSIEEGLYVRLTGYRSRDGRPMILVENEHWDGGGIVELDPADGSVVRKRSPRSRVRLHQFRRDLLSRSATDAPTLLVPGTGVRVVVPAKRLPEIAIRRSTNTVRPSRLRSIRSPTRRLPNALPVA